MTINNNTNLINQICTFSGLSGKALDELKTRLAKMSETELQAELTKTISGDNFTEEMGLVVEKISTTSQVEQIQNQSYSQSRQTVPKPIVLTEEQAQEQAIKSVVDDVIDARDILMHVDNGIITKGYDKLKTSSFNIKKAGKEDEYRKNIMNVNLVFGDLVSYLVSGYLYDKYMEMGDLSYSNVEENVALQAVGTTNMQLAKNNQLSKKEYYLQNKEHLKTMLVRRLYMKDLKSGDSFIDRNRGNMSQEEFGKFLENYINDMVDNIQELDSIKSMQSKLTTFSGEETEEFCQKLLENAKNQPQKVGEVTFKISQPAVPAEFNTTEPISFEEVFRYERGREFSKENIESFLNIEADFNYTIGAFNKHQVLKNAVDGYRKDYDKHYSSAGIASAEGVVMPLEPSPIAQAEKVTTIFEEYFANPINPNLAKEKLEEIISTNKLPIIVNSNENGELSLDLSALTSDNTKNRALNNILSLLMQEQNRQLEEIMGGNPDDTMFRYQQKYSLSRDSAYGSEYSNDLAKAMDNDNKTVIKRVTGGVSSVGMGMTVVGGVLCFTPLAPLGATLLTAGNTTAITGMVSESALGYTEALTRNDISEEELIEITKTTLMNAGGFGVGMVAGKVGMKAFKDIIDEKLVATFNTEIANGNRAAALKAVFCDPNNLANFMQAAGAKVGTDFLISYAGDLAMMGVLGTQDDWQSLLKSNLIGIMVGMSSDIKDVSGVGRPRNFGISDGVKPMTEMDYGQRYSTNDVAEVKESVKVSNNTRVKNSGENDFEVEYNDYKGLAGSITLKSSQGEQLGNINYTVLEQNGRKVLKFEGLESNKSGMNIGTKLIEELVMKSIELGAEGRLIAEASPATGSGANGRPMSNLGFYYKLGFKADDPAIDAKIRECIDKGKEIPLSLNIFTKISLTDEGINTIVKNNKSNQANLIDTIDSTMIPKELKTTWENCKYEISSIIKQIEKGVIKLDKKIDEVILNLKHISANVSGKIKSEIDNLINEFKEYVRVSRDKLDNIPIEQQLVSIKDIDGTQRYSNSEIRQLIENVPDNLSFTKKELVDLMNLKAMTVNDAIELMAKIDSDDKFKILNTLTSQRNTNDSAQTYNYLEIENFFDNLDSCEITDMYNFFVGAIDDYKYFGKNLISKESYLNELSYHLKTDKQVQIYRNMISRIKKKDCTMLPGEVFKYLDLKNEILELKMYDVSPKIMQLHSEIKNIHPLSEEQELLLSFIDDEYILSYLKDELASINYWESIALLKSVTEADGTLFSDDNAFYQGGTKLYDFYDYAQKNNINIDDIEMNFRHSAINSFQASALPIDIELAARFNHLREYIGNGSNEEVKNYLYDNLYLKTLKNFGINTDIILKLDEINNKYNVKIMISSNIKEIDDILKYIELELQEWNSASNGVAKMPPVIDFNSADSAWYDLSSTQVNTAAGAYSSPCNGSLAFNQQTLSSLHWAIRHEMTHSNDLKAGQNINQSYLEIDQKGMLVLDKYGAVKPKRTKALERELLNAGINRNHIDYAFVNTEEFIAVASEGNMSKYSQEFKNMLVEFGMPEWMFKMKCKKEIKTMLK